MMAGLKWADFLQPTRKGGTMPRLKLHTQEDDAPTLLFPGVKRKPVRATGRTTAPTAESIRLVEDAMKDAELKFDRLRRMLGYTDDGHDRPRAA